MSNTKNVKSLVFRIINVVIVAGLGVFLVYYLLSGIELSDLKKSFIQAHIPSLLIGFLLWILMDFTKTYRQNILVGSADVRYGDMFLVTLVRDAFNMVLPARTGELSYIYVLRRKFKIPVEVGVSTLAIGLIFELIIVFCMIIISIIIVGVNRFAVSSTTVIIISAALLAASLLLLFYLSKIVSVFIKLGRYLLQRFEKLKNSKAFNYFYDKLVETNNSIEIIQGRRVYWKVYLLSIGNRVLKYSSYYFLIHAFLKPLGYSFADLPYWSILLATIAAEMSAVLPTHAVAGLGTYEGAFVLASVGLGFSKEHATIAGFNYHILNLAVTVIQGLIAVIILVLPFYKSKRDMAVAEKAENSNIQDN
ncbi:MAG: flippase-like domain-containing protein, partial [Actinobacteria bacterium]|nr:flippase-like domain-containing protein [Actinomycetota bacterium]